MKTVDIRAKSDDELNSELAIMKKAQYNLRFQQSGGQLEKTHEVRKTRRSIAKLMTVMNERKTGETASVVKTKKA